MSLKVNGEVHITRREAAKRLCISVQTLDREITKGRIEYFQSCPGARITFTEAQLQDYIEQCRRPVRVEQNTHSAA